MSTDLTNKADPIECPVCYDELYELYTETGKQCNHKLCSICFDKLIYSTNKCPLCRANLVSKKAFKKAFKQIIDRLALRTSLERVTEELLADHIRSEQELHALVREAVDILFDA